MPVLLLVLFDFWPPTALTAKLPGAGRQPWLGILTLLMVGLIAGALWLAYVGQGMDIVVFMVRIGVGINFGCFILLVMFKGLPALKQPQAWRGLLLTLLGVTFPLMMVIGSYFRFWPLRERGVAGAGSR